MTPDASTAIVIPDNSGVETYFKRVNIEIIPPISSSEIAELLDQQEFLKKIMDLNSLMRENVDISGYEAGIAVVRSIKNGALSVSEINSGTVTGINLDNVPFNELSDEEMSGFSLAPPGLTDRPNTRDTWSTLDIATLHFHPLKTTDDAPKSRWFNPSFRDHQDTQRDGLNNSLKMRIMEGLSAHQLRSIPDAQNDQDLSETEIELREEYYGYFMTTTRGKAFKLQTHEFSAAEARFRPYQMIGMSLSENKAQILILYDDPELVRASDEEIPMPSAFSREPFDLENDSSAKHEIINYYRSCGFSAEIIFIEQNQTKIEGRVFNSQSD